MILADFCYLDPYPDPFNEVDTGGRNEPIRIRNTAFFNNGQIFLELDITLTLGSMSWNQLTARLRVWSCKLFTSKQQKVIKIKSIYYILPKI